MKKLNKKGFTLIELLVVVAIIAILAGIVLVSLNSARTRSEKASLQSTMASVMPVLSMCVNDGGTIQTATPTVAGNDICGGTVTDITEDWPVLPTDLSGKGYNYALDNDTTPTALVGTMPNTTDTIRCSISTGSCTTVAGS
jgi:prepilin-type N-terminal cleavage/methylation domain-containing protein